MPHPPHPLATTHQILVTPSREANVPSDVEDDLRVVGCMLIQELGILLDLPQSTLATAQVLLQRFFYVSSLLSYSVNDIAIGSLYLSVKLTEKQVRLRDLLNVYILYTSRQTYLQSLPSLRPPLGTSTPKKDEVEVLLKDFKFTPPSYHSEIYYELKDTIVIAEMQILKRLGFNVQVDLPYSHMINYCKILDLVNKPGVVQKSWSILNDALQTPIYAHYPPPTIACFSILLSTRLLRIPLPKDWWILFDADYDDMWIACGYITRLWKDWGRAESGNDHFEGEAEDGLKEARWRRAWQLSVSRKYVRRYVERMEQGEEPAIAT